MANKYSDFRYMTYWTKAPRRGKVLFQRNNL